MPVPKTSMMSKLRLFMGVFWLLTSLVMIWGYYNWSYITDDWQLVTQLMYRSGVVLSGFVGVTLIISSWANIRRGFVTPQIGNNRLIIPIEGIVYLGIMMVMLVGSLLTRQNTLLLVFAMLAGAFVVNGWQTFGMLQSAKLFRTTPKRAMAGDLFSVELTVVNRHPLLTSWMISVEDTIQSSSEVLNATILFARIANRSSQEGHYQLRLAHRGRYQFGPIVVSSRFPLGLVERSRMFSMTAEVLVYP
ncbi:MAG: hypothetical protein FJ267_18370, partial [Planctomycetes bacterium]|nr:hypothetical protein [Planctomycetota bacterium]